MYDVHDVSPRAFHRADCVRAVLLDAAMRRHIWCQFSGPFIDYCLLWRSTLDTPITQWRINTPPVIVTHGCDLLSRAYAFCQDVQHGLLGIVCTHASQMWGWVSSLHVIIKCCPKVSFGCCCFGGCVMYRVDYWGLFSQAVVTWSDNDGGHR